MHFRDFSDFSISTNLRKYTVAHHHYIVRGYFIWEQYSTSIAVELENGSHHATQAKSEASRDEEASESLPHHHRLVCSPQFEDLAVALSQDEAMSQFQRRSELDSVSRCAAVGTAGVALGKTERVDGDVEQRCEVGGKKSRETRVDETLGNRPPRHSRREGHPHNSIAEYPPSKARTNSECGCEKDPIPSN